MRVKMRFAEPCAQLVPNVDFIAYGGSCRAINDAVYDALPLLVKGLINGGERYEFCKLSYRGDRVSVHGTERVITSKDEDAGGCMDEEIFLQFYPPEGPVKCPVYPPVVLRAMRCDELQVSHRVLKLVPEDYECLACGICTRVLNFTKPVVVLPCRHVLCFEDFYKLRDYTLEQGIPCHLCRAPALPKDGEVDVFDELFGGGGEQPQHGGNQQQHPAEGSRGAAPTGEAEGMQSP